MKYGEKEIEKLYLENLARAGEMLASLQCAIRGQNISGTPQNMKQNSGLQKRKCNPRPGELAADLTGAAHDAGY
jgi:hypothetical protein